MIVQCMSIVQSLLLDIGLFVNSNQLIYNIEHSIMFLKQIFFLSCLTVSSFASQSSHIVSGQSYQKIDFPLQVWNLFSSKKTEMVTIFVPDALNSGTAECGVACDMNHDCGGFLYDKVSGSCSMKQALKNF